MRNVIIWGKKFVPYIENDTIQKAVRENAALINKWYEGATEENAPVFISILNGAFMYTSDLMKELNFPCELHFVKVTSYVGDNSTGKVTEVIGLNCSLEGRDVIIIDDIIDTGLTMKTLCEKLALEKPKSLRVGAFIYKSGTCCADLKVDFPCITLKESAFIVGYGLDYNGLGRNYKDIWVLG